VSVNKLEHEAKRFSEEQRDKIESQIRYYMEPLSRYIHIHVHDTRERDLALTALEEMSLWLHASIVKYGVK
jgi:hypothetical protein